MNLDYLNNIFSILGSAIAVGGGIYAGLVKYAKVREESQRNLFNTLVQSNVAVMESVIHKTQDYERQENRIDELEALIHNTRREQNLEGAETKENIRNIKDELDEMKEELKNSFLQTNEHLHVVHERLDKLFTLIAEK